MAFSQNESLEAHTKRHAGEKPYQCGQCNKALKYKTHLDIHVRIHNGENLTSVSIVTNL